MNKCYLISFLIITNLQGMNILIVGGGGREHALAWKVGQSPLVQHIFVAPGNAGTAHEPKTQNVEYGSTNIDELVTFAQQHNIDLTIVGPEVPLSLGIVDQFQQKGLLCFGPSQKAAYIESSKIFAKEFMQSHAIPTASFKSFSDVEQAKAYVRDKTFPLVIKADGLAAGKGTMIVHTLQEAIDAIELMMINKKFGEAGSRIIIEEFIRGKEVSFIVMTDGKNIVPLETAQDYKTRDEHNQGPMTGGMGAYSPNVLITPELHQYIMKEIIEPTVRGLEQEGRPFVGFLYAGLMVSPEGEPNVLEFNCRLGDPETQVILMRLASDLVPLCQAALEEKLDQVELRWHPEPSVGVVVASDGYPSRYCKGYVITGLPKEIPADCKIFHAGTTHGENDTVITSGGRVLCMTARGSTIKEAREKVYHLVERVTWPLRQYRKDIAFFNE